MHKISVPVVLHERFDKDATLAELRRAGTDRVFLAVGIPSCKKEQRENRKKDRFSLSFEKIIAKSQKKP